VLKWGVGIEFPADAQPYIVETSPASASVSFALRKRLKILPELVFGSDATNSSEDGVAIGPNSL
jgi:hypothetical protein